MENQVNSDDAVDRPRAAKGDSLQRKGRKVIVFSVEGHEIRVCGQHNKVGSADPPNLGMPTCQTNHNCVGQAVPCVSVSPPTATESQASDTNTDRQCDPRASSSGEATTTAGESVMPVGTSDCVVVVNGGASTPAHQFFLPCDEDDKTENVRDHYGQSSVQTDGLTSGLKNTTPQKATFTRHAVARGQSGVQFLGPNHIFTVVPVGSGDLRTDRVETQTHSACTGAGTDTDTPVKRKASTRSHVIPSSSYYSPYSTLKVPPVTRKLTSNPYLTLGREGQVAAASYNAYHTITGLVPSSYQRSEGGLRRVSTSKREYGVGGSGSSVPPSLVNVVLPSVSFPTGAPPASGLHRVRTMPCPPTTSTRRWSRDITHVPEAWPVNTSSEYNTVHSLNQMTVRSAGGLSIDVGSTDGRNVKIHGAVESPEQLPLLPSVSGGGKNDVAAAKESRQTWENKAQFVLACIGYAVGLGNVWRFPYLCYKSGGGAFLIPYFVMLFACGIPLLLMELSVGQYTRRGPIAALGKICPLFKGAGVGTVVISFLLCTYYNVIIAWAIYYLVQSFYSELPWTSCNTTWAVNCFDDYAPNVTAPKGMKSVTEDFFDEVVLEKSSGIHEGGGLRLELVLALFLAWVLVYFALWKSVKSSGRTVYVTATLPYLIIGAFMWRALTLPGASQGLQYFFNPRWELLLSAEVWINAASQNFNSIGIAFGSMIAFASYNKFNNNIVLDTWAISLTNSITSLLAGTIVFSTLGNIALEQGKDIDDVVAEGPGLVFVVYPQALAKMPYANVWAVLFFCMLLMLGVDSQFATVEVIVTSLTDAFPNWIKKYLRRHEILVLIVCTVSFLLGLPNVMRGGIYYFHLIDYYTAAISLMYLAFFEVVAIVWIYGANRLASNVQEMTGRLPSLYFRFCWYIAAPALILIIWIFSMVDYKHPSYNEGEYAYPDWAIGIGWLFASFSIAPIPIFAVIAIINAKGTTLLEKMRNSVKSQLEECTCCSNGPTCFDTTHNNDSKDQIKLVVYSPHSGSNTAGTAKSDQLKEAEINGENTM